VEQSVKQGDVEGALNVLEKMRDVTKGKSLTHFLSPDTVSTLEAALENSPSLMRVRSGSGSHTKPKAPSAASQQNLLVPPPRRQNHEEAEDEDDEDVDEEEEVEEILSNEEDEDEDEEEEVIYKRTTANKTTTNNSYT